ncbi:MAG: toprim domain-containing protein, partial [Thermoguttaceae bacterium]|nr:toprim domain-containing protein [Thermoguttaceae bacterium]
VVATLGTALTEEQARLMKRYAPEVWISYDGDSAGQKAALRALDILDAQALPARVIDYPEGMDPDDFVKARGPSGVDALPTYDSTSYRMLRARDGLNLAVQDDMTQYALKCCAILRNVKNPVEMENHLRRLVNETGYDREILLRQIGASPQAPTQPPARRRPAAGRAASGVEKAEQELISMLAAGLIPADLLKPGDFSDETHRALVEWLLAGKPAGAYVEGIDDEAARKKIMQALNYAPLPTEREKALEEAEDCLRTIQYDRDSQRSEQIKQQINSASAEQKAEMYRRMAAMWNSDEN